MWRRILASRWFYAAAAAAMLAAFVASQLRLGTDPRPRGSPEQIAELAGRRDLNLVFILIDTLRADRLGSYGYGRDTSPTLDALAATGIRFASQASQSSWTKCSMASMWTGLYPVRTGVTRSPQALADGAHLPAEILREAGYHTFAIWRNGWVAPSFGFSQGFEAYHSPRPTPIPPSVRRERPTIGISGTDQDLVRSAAELLRTQGDERFFLYLHLMDVHQYVYDDQSALFGTAYSDIYDNAIHWVDSAIGHLVAEIDARGLRERTLIVVAADHGEAFGEHGREGHARDIYGEVTTTPWILSLPFRLEPGIVVQGPTENVDVWPTLLDLLGLPPLEATDGRSRVPEIQAAARGEDAPADGRPRFAHIDQSWSQTAQPPRPMVGVSQGPYRLIFRADRESGELYDRSTDLHEQRDVGPEHPEVLARMTGLAREYLAKPPAPWEVAPEVALPPEELDQLRALGYEVGK
jgi:choline-sulfatase